MEVIKIPKVKVLELIKNNECSFYEQESYTDIKVKNSYDKAQNISRIYWL